MPYRIDLRHPPDGAFDRLIDLGALDVEVTPTGVAALVPDRLAPSDIVNACGSGEITVSPADGRDDDSVWVLRPRDLRVGSLQICPAGAAAPPGALQLLDRPAFGTGLHPTTAMCLETLHEHIRASTPDAMLDVGTGSGILALAALALGVPRVVGLDLDPASLGVAAANARLNRLDHRLRLVVGGPDVISGTWPLVVANILAAPLIELAPTLVRRVGPGGRLVLSGIASAVAPDVRTAYTRFGMREDDVQARSGWIALTLRATW